MLRRWKKVQLREVPAGGAFGGRDTTDDNGFVVTGKEDEGQYRYDEGCIR